jgi:hypothetical protein
LLACAIASQVLAHLQEQNLETICITTSQLITSSTNSAGYFQSNHFTKYELLAGISSFPKSENIRTNQKHTRSPPCKIQISKEMSFQDQRSQERENSILYAMLWLQLLEGCV